ncbi:MAG TPA: PAS domain-containing sensor histidine kinase [Burkholderiales bacterium]|nr:PAS domain-containing sensor histidine kinase [Burkholderiales bacterium]
MNPLRPETAVDYLEGLLEGFVAYDADWVMTYMNAAGERILGRRREEVLGKTWHEAFPHAVGNPVDEMYQRVMRARVGETMEYHYPHYGRWMEISASPVRTGGVGVYFRDISDRKRAEQALREADRRKDEFLATLAHELRNPLAPIRNGLHLLRAGGEAAVRAQAMMERQVANLVRLLDDLMEVSRITTGQLALRKKMIDLGDAVRTAVEVSEPSIRAGLHRLELDLPAKPLRVLADPLRISQVLSNLLNNAAKYTPDGGRIWLSVRRVKGRAVIRVQDDGIGIAPEMLPRVFERFVQVPSALKRSHGGLGIGLSLAKTLVELHGGRIEARSAGEGKGAEFIVSLPALAAHPPGGKTSR